MRVNQRSDFAVHQQWHNDVARELNVVFRLVSKVLQPDVFAFERNVASRLVRVGFDRVRLDRSDDLRVQEDFALNERGCGRRLGSL